MTFFIFSVESSSAGFGGIGPLARTNRLLMRLLLTDMFRSMVTSKRMLVKPGSLSMLK